MTSQSNGFVFFKDSSRDWLIFKSDWMIQLLHSSSVTVLSLLLQVNSPLCSASVLSLLRDLRLSFSLNIRTTGSHVPYESLNQDHATYMPDAAQTVSKFLLYLSRKSRQLPVLTSSLAFRHVIAWLTFVRLLESYLILSCRTFFLNAHHHGSLPQQLEVV
jgi:hypothetical protein